MAIIMANIMVTQLTIIIIPIILIILKAIKKESDLNLCIQILQYNFLYINNI